MSNKTEWSESRIQDKLRLYFLSSSSKKYELINKFLYSWESDYIAITKSGYVYECEIKISRTDFFHDVKKQHKFLIIEGKITNYERPNYFYYVVPRDLVSVDEVPNGYGLVYVDSWGIEIVKKAEQIHKEKADFEKLKLIDKFYYGMWDMYDRYRKNDVDKLKKRIKNLEKDLKVYDDELSFSTSKISELELELKKLKGE